MHTGSRHSSIGIRFYNCVCFDSGFHEKRATLHTYTTITNNLVIRGGDEGARRHTILILGHEHEPCA